jgi:hypothetical protein
MKKLIILFIILFFGGTSITGSYGEERTVAALDKTTFVVVKDRGSDLSAVELFQVVNGKIQVMDAILVKEDRLNQSIKFFRFEKIAEDINVR